MKKIAMLLFFVCISLAFGGCTSNVQKEIKKASKNLSEYTMQIEYNDYELNIKQTIDYKNNYENELSDLYMHVYVNNFAVGAVNSPVSVTNKNTAYPNGESYGTFEIQSLQVNGQDTEAVFYGKDDDFLKIDLTESLAPSERIQLQMEYSVTIPNCLHRFGYGDNTINVANFYPIMSIYENGEWVLDPYHYNGDPFYSEMANYYVTLTAPSKYVVASTGESKKNDNGDTATYNITAKAVRDFAFVLSEKFEVVSEQYEHTTINYYYYDDENPTKSLKAGVDAIATFSNLFGTYPYTTFSIVKTNFVHGGMEFPNLVYISDSVTNHDDYINVIIHETAHQWWYGLVGSNAYRNPWLDEGLTDFSTAYFYSYNTDYNVSYTDVIKNTTNSYVTFVDIYTKILGDVDTSMNRALNEYNTEPEYVYITYVKGALLFDSLKELVGQEKFNKALKNYVSKNKYSNVTPDHLIGEFEKVMGTDMTGWFNSWINGEVVIKSVE